jgi:hypothetical protein
MQHSFLRFEQLVLLITVLYLAAHAHASDRCPRIFTPAKVVQMAKDLDGQIICVRAMLRPLPIRDRASNSLFVYEVVPLDAKQRQLDANRIGLVEWDEELGIDKSLYRPESEKILVTAANRCPGTLKNELSYDVEFRAVVEYKKNLTEHAYATLPPNLSAMAPRKTHYDIELVPLEYFKATAICKR